MSEIIRVTRLRWWLVMLAGSAAWCQTQAASPTGVFTSKEFAYSMVTPSGWKLVRVGETPLFLTPECGPTGAVIDLQPGCATIGFEIVRRDPSLEWLSSLQAFSERITHAAASAHTPLSVADVPPGAKISGVLATVFDKQMATGEHQVHHCIMAFWEHSGVFFEARLHYVRSDSKGNQYEQAFWDTVGSFRPLAQAARK